MIEWWDNNEWMSDEIMNEWMNDDEIMSEWMSEWIMR